MDSPKDKFGLFAKKTNIKKFFPHNPSSSYFNQFCSFIILKVPRPFHKMTLPLYMYKYYM